ncbi:hypothetical protein HDU83_002570 [Entophlyctis luteolus]|nr:hypothetical protein HDU83_002570 [Entophlyctis luteolus]
MRVRAHDDARSCGDATFLCKLRLVTSSAGSDGAAYSFLLLSLPLSRSHPHSRTLAFAESLSLDGITDRTARVIPAYKRNHPRAILAHLASMLSQQHPSFIYTCSFTHYDGDSSSFPSECNVSISGSLNGLAFAWELNLKPTPSGDIQLSPDAIVASLLVAPLAACTDVLVAQLDDAERALRDREREIRDLRAALPASPSKRVAKASAPFSTATSREAALETALSSAAPTFASGTTEIIARLFASSSSPHAAPHDTFRLLHASVAARLLSGGTASSHFATAQDSSLPEGAPLKYDASFPSNHPSSSSTAIQSEQLANSSNATHTKSATIAAPLVAAGSEDDGNGDLVTRRLRELVAIAEKKKDDAAASAAASGLPSKQKKRKII